ncbi:MAG: hypothetical protein ACKO4Q_06675 [Planctomycetota bacterium]
MRLSIPRSPLAALVTLALALPSVAQSVWSDDFNRANGAMGGDWTVQNGTFLISNGRAYSTGGDHHWAMHNSANANWRNQKVTVDFLPRVQGPPLFYVGVLLGARTDWLGVFLKVQDNNGDGLYDRVFFWNGVNAGSSWGSPSFFNLSQAIPSGRMTAYFTNNGDVANLDIDRNFDGTVDEHFQLAGLLASPLAPLLASEVGMVSYGSPGIDNFQVRDTGVALPVAYCTAGTTSAGCVPAMGATGTPSASASGGFTLSCTAAEGQRSAIVFYSISGEQAQPWSTGSTSFLCVKAPTQRTLTQSSGGTAGQCDGALSLDFLAWSAANPGAIGTPLAAGRTFWTQAWLRDPPAPKTTSLSNGLRFTLLP